MVIAGYPVVSYKDYDYMRLLMVILYGKVMRGTISLSMKNHNYRH